LQRSKSHGSVRRRGVDELSADNECRGIAARHEGLAYDARPLVDVCQPRQVQVIHDANAVALNRFIDAVLQAVALIPVPLAQSFGMGKQLGTGTGGNQDFDPDEIRRPAELPVSPDAILDAHDLLLQPRVGVSGIRFKLPIATTGLAPPPPGLVGVGFKAMVTDNLFVRGEVAYAPYGLQPFDGDSSGPYWDAAPSIAKTGIGMAF
jgi:hypothetical protein